MSFKFTGFDQLRKLRIDIPQTLVQEVQAQATKIKENEEKSIEANTNRARQPIPNFISRPKGPSHQSAQATQPPASADTPRPSVPPPTGSQPNMNWETSQNQHQNAESQRTPTMAAPNRFPAPHSTPGGGVQAPDLSQPPPAPGRPQPRRNMSWDGSRPPAPKYHRPSYSPNNQPTPGLFQTSSPSDTRQTQSRFPGSAPGPVHAAYYSSDFMYNDPRVTPNKYFGM